MNCELAIVLGKMSRSNFKVMLIVDAKSIEIRGILRKCNASQQSRDCNSLRSFIDNSVPSMQALVKMRASPPKCKRF